MESLPHVDPKRVWRLQWPEASFIAVGLFSSIVTGVIQPVFAILWSNIINIFFSLDSAEITLQTREYLGWFAIIALSQLVFTVLRIGLFVLAGERLTRRLRTMTFRAILRQVRKGGIVGGWVCLVTRLGRANDMASVDCECWVTFHCSNLPPFHSFFYHRRLRAAQTPSTPRTIHPLPAYPLTCRKWPSSTTRRTPWAGCPRGWRRTPRK